ncbi:MAG: hypothetical protein RLY71_4609, partial [Pseudomonadota bacterium]
YTLGLNVENGRILATGVASLTGNAQANTLFAGAGNNVLDGAAGADTASYALASAAVTVTLALPGGAQATGGSGSDTLIAIENLTGSNFADTLSGDAGANTLSGGLGADTMSGGDGNDTYAVDNVGDQVVEANAAAAGGVDLVNSTLAAYTLGSNVENGRIQATTAANLTGNAQANTLYAGAGNNLIDGGGGIDTVSYAFAGSAVSITLASQGLVQVTGGSGSDTLVGIENMTGSNFDDLLGGDAAANVLGGGTGIDQLHGGDGNDTLTGGAGTDIFVFDTLANSSTNADRITDFVSGVDFIVLDLAVYSTLNSPIALDGGLDPAQFHAGAGVVGAVAGQAAGLYYNTSTGDLYYDADGAGGAAAVKLATLAGAAPLLATDIGLGVFV